MNIDSIVFLFGIFGILLMLLGTLLGFTLFIIACVRQAKEDVGVALRNERERNEALGR